MGNPVLEVDHVSKRFQLAGARAGSVKERFISRRRQTPEDFWALRDVSLELDGGATLGLLGHNGSGKSTLLKLVGGILKPTTGTVRVSGRIASLLELGSGMHPELTGRENIFVNGAILGLSRRDLEQRFDDIVAFAELEQFIDEQVKHYSSGMFVRLGFSVAVNVEPDILLVDEVLAVGDENFQRKCLDRVRRFQREGRTIIVVSHAADQIRQVCDRVAVLDRGELVAIDEPARAIRVFREHMLDDELERRARDAEQGAEAVAVEASPDSPLSVAGIGVEPTPYAAHGVKQEERRNLRVRITHVGVEHEHSDTRRYLLPGERLVIRVGYETDEAIDDVAFGLGIFDHATGRPIFGTNTDILGRVVTSIQGAGEVVFEIPAVPLLDGTYPITVGIHSHDEATVYDWQEQRSWFEVMSPDRTSGLVWIPVKAKATG